MICSKNKNYTQQKGMVAMLFYEDLVMQAQGNYGKDYSVYASGSTPYQLTDKEPLPYSEQINRLVQQIREADCVVVGGASGLSASGGGDFYYEDNASYRKYFRPFAEKYHFKGAFAGMMHRWQTREEYWGYLATFLHTTQTAPVRPPYLDLDALLAGKDFFVLTTNQDTQFVKLYSPGNGGHPAAVGGSWRPYPAHLPGGQVPGRRGEEGAVCLERLQESCPGGRRLNLKTERRRQRWLSVSKTVFKT